MEIINKKDGESRNDRILWDNINTMTIPQGRTVWGFSNDDSHSNSAIGFSFNMFEMPMNGLEQFRAAMRSGSFYVVAKVAWNEGVNNQDLNTPTPVVTSVAASAASITVTAENYHRIDWITEGTRVIAQGNTIDITALAGELGCFVRANIIGSGGIVFTQPFVVAKLPAHSNIDRPDWGVTDRPGWGVTDRPGWGVTDRPGWGVTDRPGWGVPVP